MTARLLHAGALTVVCLVVCCALGAGPDIKAPPVDTWVTATGEAAGTDAAAKDQAVAAALRKAVEQACGVFLTSQSKVQDYKTVYDKVFANTVGYVIESKEPRIVVEGGITKATVTARVSTQKFEKDWAVIAHTINQEGNPRVIVAIVEATKWATATMPTYELDQSTVQSKIEDFFLQKGIALVDKDTAAKVNKRDILLASVKDDTTGIAALGARFHADVVVVGKAIGQFSKTIDIADQKMYQFTASLSVRAIQCDSARVLASKAFDPVTVNSLQRGGGEEKALIKMADENAPKLLAAVVEAWRKRANVSRNVELLISGLEHEGWKAFKAEVEKIDGVQALRLREIIEGTANIDVECQSTNEIIADRLTELKSVKLKVTEITANRIKLKVVQKEEK